MKISPAPSLKAALTRTILWFVAAFVAGAVCLIEHFQAWQGEAAASGAAIVVAEVLAGQIDPSVSQESARAACARAISHPSILAAWLIDNDHRIVASATRFPDFDSPGCVRADPACQTTRSARVAINARPGWPTGDASLIDVPLRSSVTDAGPGAETCRTLRALVQFDALAAPWYARLLRWVWPLLLLGALGSAVALRKLQREILGPLSELRRLADRGRDGDGVHTAPAERRGLSVPNALPQEFHDLAHTFVALHTDREEWRARAQQAARTVDAHVAQRTQAIHSELKRAQREIWTDPLTRLANRRVMQDRFGAIFDAQREAGQDLSVVMLDIDHFKQLNDQLGHPCGDDLLKFTAELLRGTLRSNDLAIRYGGDEFTLVLPSVGVADAAAIAQRLCALFSQRTRLLPLETPPSLSAGVASLCTHCPANADELLAHADSALYDAKSVGRNAVRVYGEQSAASTPIEPRASSAARPGPLRSMRPVAS